MKAARLNPMSQQAALRAELRNDADNAKTPFTLSLHDGVVSYVFTDPPQELQLVLGEDGSELRERVGGKAVAPARYDQKLRGSAITYEDLALRLLYWPKPKLLGEDWIRTFKAWKIQVQAPRGQSQYGVAIIWIAQESGAVLRIDGFGRDGKLAKRFEMLSGQKIDGRWMLKTMRVETYDPKTGEVSDRTYLKVLGAAK